MWSCENGSKKLSYTAADLLAPCLQGTPWFRFFNSSPATRKKAVCLKNKTRYVLLGNYQLGWLTMGEFEFYLKKLIILVFESASISVTLSSACCMWCNHLSAAWWVTGNGRWRPISAGWPTESIFDDLLTWYII